MLKDHDTQFRNIHIEKSIVMYQYNNYNTYEPKGLRS